MASKKSEKAQPKKRLGKGLEALFTTNNVDVTQNLEETSGFDVVEVSVGDIRPNPYQPRKHFDATALAELAESIKEHGVFQPLIVRKGPKGYDLLAGERRLRASKIAKLKTVPVIVKDYTEQQMMELALLENLQREDLSAIEEAKAYRNLMDKLNFTQEILATRVGKSRSHIANTLRLLQLPRSVQDAIETHLITMGHAKVLITVPNEKVVMQIVDLIIEEGLSVREVEKLVQNIHSGTPAPIKAAKKQAERDAQLEKIETMLSQRFEQHVKFQYKSQRGKITIPFQSDDELNQILEKLGMLETGFDV